MAWVRRNWPVLLLVLFPLIPLWRAAFLGEAIGPFDQIRQMAPWSEEAPDRPWDVLQADGALQFYAWRDLVFEAWGSGQMPYWNPYQLAGTPLLANSQSAAFYPPHILMGILHVPTQTAMFLLAWFHLAWAGLGLLALARRMGASSSGAAIGGLIFAGSPFMIAWIGLPSVISTCAWIPWALYALYGVFDGAKSRQGLAAMALLAFSVAMMVLAGHLQFAFYGLLALFVLGVARLIGEWFGKAEPQVAAPEPAPRKLKRLRPARQEPATEGVEASPDPSSRGRRVFIAAGLAVAGVALGLGLAAPQLLPVLEYSKSSHRRNVPSAEGYEAYVAGGIAPFELAGLVYPGAMGRPFEFSPNDKPLSQYWPALVKRGSNFAEGAIGIGPLALAGLLLFPWGSRRRRVWAPMAGLAALAFLVALGTPVNRLLYFGIPGWSSTGSPGRMAVLFILAVAALAAVGWGRASDEPATSTRWSRAAFGVGAAVLVTLFALVSMGGSLQPRFEGMDPVVIQRLVSQSVSNGLIPAVLAIAVAIAGYLALRGSDGLRSRAPGLIASSIGLLAAATLFPLYFNYVPTSAGAYSRPSDLPESPVDRITGINDPWELVVAAPAVLPPNTASALRIHDLAGYDSLIDRETHELLGRINGQDPAPPANGNIQFVKPTANLDLLSDAGVGYVLSRSAIFPNLKSESIANGLICYKLDGPGRAYTYAGPARVEDRFDRQIVHAIGAGQLTVKDRNMPGWRAFVNGTERPIAPGIWRTVELPEGEHRVEFVYDPPGLRTGLMLFLPAALLTVSAAVVGRPRRKVQN